MARKAQVHIYRRGDSWQVYYAGTKPRYTKSWPTEFEALRDKELLMRRIAGVGIEKFQMRSVESALHRLGTVQAPGRGKSLEFVVEWFLVNFKGDDTSLTLNEYGAAYLAKKELKLEVKSMVEITSYIQHFMAKFGHLKPAEVSVAALEEYMKQSSARFGVTRFFGLSSLGWPARPRVRLAVCKTHRWRGRRLSLLKGWNTER